MCTKKSPHLQVGLVLEGREGRGIERVGRVGAEGVGREGDEGTGR